MEHLLRTSILFNGLILRLFFFYCAIVIDEDKGAIIIGVRVPLSTFVARAEVARWIIFWKRGLRSGFLLASMLSISMHGIFVKALRLGQRSLPRSLRSVRRHEDPASSKGIVPPVRYVVQNCVRHDSDSQVETIDQYAELEALSLPTH